MTLIIAKELSCDGCGEWQRIEARTLEREWPLLSREGWTKVVPKQHYCPNCSAIKKSRENGDAG